MIALALVVGACGGNGSSSKVFDGIGFPAGSEVIKRYGGDGAGNYFVAVTKPLTEADIKFPDGFRHSLLGSYETLETHCVDESNSDGPEPSSSCRATRIAVRQGPDPSDPEDRYCTISVEQWTDTYSKGGRRMLIANVGLLCNSPREQLGD